MSLTQRHQIAVIVPVQGDAPALAVLLGTMADWRPAPHEIIVVGAADDPPVRSLCVRYGCRHLVVAGPRGTRLDAGARASEAPVLWFLHADAQPPSRGLDAIAAALAEGAESGCFRFRFQGPRRWYKSALEAMIALRERAGGMAYGDQGLYALRSAYLECGGFAAQPLFEEVALVKRLRARRTFRLLATPIGVSTRRWDRDGWWRRTLHNRWLALCYMCGGQPQRLARAYRHAPAPERKVNP